MSISDRECPDEWNATREALGFPPLRRNPYTGEWESFLTRGLFQMAPSTWEVRHADQ